MVQSLQLPPILLSPLHNTVSVQYVVFSFNIFPSSLFHQLGFLPPTGQSNLAVKDIVTALNFLQRVVPSFGGCSSKITLAGQSSGATMIRALLAAPSASPLFQSGILQSDAMVN